MARLWADAVNRHGGDATLVHLPEIGIRGNTHFPFSDLNNLEIAACCPSFSRRGPGLTERADSLGPGLTGGALGRRADLGSISRSPDSTR